MDRPNINEADIKKEVSAYIKSKFLRGDESMILDDDISFLEKRIIDSTGVLELVGYIEERFSIEVKDEEMVPDNLDSLNKLTVYIMEKVTHAG